MQSGMRRVGSGGLWSETDEGLMSGGWQPGEADIVWHRRETRLRTEDTNFSTALCMSCGQQDPCDSPVRSRICFLSGAGPRGQFFANRYTET